MLFTVDTSSFYALMICSLDEHCQHLIL